MIERASQSSLATLIDTIESLARAETAEDISASVRSAARRLTGADGVAVITLKGDRVYYVDEDAVGPLWKGQDFPIDACISGWAIKHRQTVVINDVRDDPRVPRHLYENTFVRSLVMAPVRASNPIGAVGAYWADVRAPTAEEIESLEIVARATAAALENIVLRASLKSAGDNVRTSEKAKAAFLANMSHEMRTPLNGVTALTELLLGTPLDAKQGELVSLVATSADHLARLVADILDFSKIEAGRMELVPIPFDLERCVQSVVGLLQPRADEKGISLTVTIKPRARRSFIGDELRIKQVITNLLTNAIKFTEQGGVSVSIDELDAIDARSMISIDVTDTGIGFDEALAPALFERFMQADASLRRAHGGVGLGLAITRALVDAMSGSIEVRSREGLGSSFVVHLPMERAGAAGAGDARPGDQRTAPQPVRDRDRRLRVLCAEDHPVNQTVIKLSLEAMNLDLTMVGDGAQALEALLDTCPDLILLDMQMPVLDGLATTVRIRANERERALPRIPIVMLTANAMQLHVSAAFAAGVDGFVAKPMKPAQLIEAIEVALRGAGGQAGASSAAVVYN